MGGSGVKDEPEEGLSSSQIFHKVFPEYLAMGMTYEQFWQQDCSLVIAYRKAYRIRQEEDNRRAWMNGLYIAKALQCVPQFVQGFIPKGTKIPTYPEKPIDFIQKKPMTEQERYDEEVRKRSERLRDGMTRFMLAFNAERRERELLEAEKGVVKDAGRDGAES